MPRFWLEHGEVKSDESLAEFDDVLLWKIEEGLKEGLDVEVYAKPEITWELVEELYERLQNGMDPIRYKARLARGEKGVRYWIDDNERLRSNYSLIVFSVQKRDLLAACLKEGLAVKTVANPLFSYGQMTEVKFGLEQGVDVSKYANVELDDRQMMELRMAMLQGFNLELFKGRCYSEMHAIRNACEQGVSEDKIREAIEKTEDSIELVNAMRQLVTKHFSSTHGMNCF